MVRFLPRLALVFCCAALCVVAAGCSQGELVALFLRPEQRALSVREPAAMPRAAIPPIPPPPTVTDPQPNLEERRLSLDEAIRISLANSTVVRVLAGVSAVSSGRTVYDPAVLNTTIDQEQSRFDPIAEAEARYDRNEQPFGLFDPFDVTGARLHANRTDIGTLRAGLSKTTVTGGTVSLEATERTTRVPPGQAIINPESRGALTLSATQPLLQGSGVAANMAPIVIARLNTERSYFQFKGALQDSVRGVIDAYWGLVFARTDVWARRQQVRQLQTAVERAEAEQRVGRASAADVAQSRTALANFKATLIAAEANQIQREAALRNILGLPPSDCRRLVPMSPPSSRRVEPCWEELLRLAEERRPDLIELKLIIEADRQVLTQARNQALPRVDATALYRWNGLEGTTPSGRTISSRPGQFTDWGVGVTFSVPLGLRRERAVLRQQELIVARDVANLDQGLHAASHELATSVRNLAQLYEQYRAFREARAAARINLEQQDAAWRLRRVIFLNVLQAITDWGNAVSAEAQALAQYNTELANLEQLTGTILESHGIEPYEERFLAGGPVPCKPRSYPATVRPGPNRPRYDTSNEPAEKSFDLEVPIKPQPTPPPDKPTLPPPRPTPPDAPTHPAAGRGLP